MIKASCLLITLVFLVLSRFLALCYCYNICNYHLTLLLYSMLVVLGVIRALSAELWQIFNPAIGNSDGCR